MPSVVEFNYRDLFPSKYSSIFYNQSRNNQFQQKKCITERIYYSTSCWQSRKNQQIIICWYINAMLASLDRIKQIIVNFAKNIQKYYLLADYH